MYHDLNIPYSSHLDRSGLDKLRLILSKCTQQNEYTVALNVTMNPNQQVRIPYFLFFFLTLYTKVPTITPPDISTLGCKYSLNILKRVTIDTDAPLDAVCEFLFSFLLFLLITCRTISEEHMTWLLYERETLRSLKKLAYDTILI